jgi:hypothetical protein
VTDADCTLTSDLGGIYFAVQASYEQQFVSANQQALNVAVRDYKPRSPGSRCRHRSYYYHGMEHCGRIAVCTLTS